MHLSHNGSRAAVCAFQYLTIAFEMPCGLEVTRQFDVREVVLLSTAFSVVELRQRNSGCLGRRDFGLYLARETAHVALLEQMLLPELASMWRQTTTATTNKQNQTNKQTNKIQFIPGIGTDCLEPALVSRSD